MRQFIQKLIEKEEVNSSKVEQNLQDLFVKEVSVVPQQTMKTEGSFDFGNNMFGSGFE